MYKNKLYGGTDWDDRTLRTTVTTKTKQVVDEDDRREKK